MRLIVVSNRLPFTVSGGRESSPRFRPSPGGVTTGLGSWLERWCQEGRGEHDYLWIGWAGGTVSPAQQPRVVEKARARYRCRPLFLEPEAIERFYHGFCNRTLWPLFHYFTSLTRFEASHWQEYQDVNQTFCEAVAAEVRPGDVVWVQDYQLMLLPRLLRERFPDLAIGFFLHIPFPSSEVFQLLPTAWRTRLLEGLLGANLVGFHTHDYTRHFLSCVQRFLGWEHYLGRLTLPDQIVKVETFPMGIEYARYAEAAVRPETAERVAQLRAAHPGQKIIFSVDRLDYTKGLVNRLRGYELFLQRHPEWHRRVVFILSVAPSRTGVAAYQAMKREIEQTVGSLQGAYSREDWAPLVYQYRQVDFDELVARYRACDVALITPLRDGMNLVAKEFVACRPDLTGVLILSELAGAAREMGEALLVNPFHEDEVAEALHRALTMSEEEQVARNRALQERLHRYDVHRWAGEFLSALETAHHAAVHQRTRALGEAVRDDLVRRYREARERALLLDYDGTLVNLVSNPRAAAPDPELRTLLRALADDPANRVAIVSGRRRVELESWLGDLPLTLVAEHGIWVRPPGEPWRMLVPARAEWKESLRSILQLYADRLPGAQVEEKEFSLVFHYRRADPDQAQQRAKELCDDLADYTRNIEVQVLQGHKVIEVRHAGAHKGTILSTWLAERCPDFLLAVGDDWTDEDLFHALPPNGVSIRVGLGPTVASYYLPHPPAVRQLLQSLLTAALPHPPVAPAARTSSTPAQDDLHPPFAPLR